jgi:D-lactate dehydrogenase
VCPSKDLTTTPRQRIVLRREIAAADAAGDTALVKELAADYRYDAVETCAVDGMCATACPVGINTGDLVKRLRTEAHGRAARAGWRTMANHWSTTTRGMALALDTATAVPPALPERTTRVARSVLGDDRVPQWHRDLPRGGTVRRSHHTADPDAVYVPSCLNTLFAPAAGGPGVLAALHTLADRAGARLVVPDPIANLCCGTPWSSKGLTDGYTAMRDRVLPALRDATRTGAIPIVTDAASCTEGFDRMLGDLPVVDAVVFVATVLLPRLVVTHRLGTLALHPTCSSTRLGINPSLQVIAEAIAHDVVVSDDWQCCGFAGDRGLLHPELTASATSAEAATVRGRDFDAYASVNRTCEIGMTRATGSPYQHVLELVERATR